MKNRARLVPLFLALGAASASLGGCEIIADFDRTKIDAGQEPFDAAAVDSSLPDAQNGGDTSAPDALGDVTTTPDASDATAPPQDSGDATAPPQDSGDASPVDSSDANQPDTSDANVPDSADAATE